jgi:glutathione S-transferase
MAESEQAWDERLARILADLAKVEAIFGSGPYFDGTEFSLADCAYAPLFMRYRLLNERHALFDASDYPKLTAWSDTLLAMDEVQRSVVSEFPDLYFAKIRGGGGHAARVFGTL